MDEIAGQQVAGRYRSRRVDTKIPQQQSFKRLDGLDRPRYGSFQRQSRASLLALSKGLQRRLTIVSNIATKFFDLPFRPVRPAGPGPYNSKPLSSELDRFLQMAFQLRHGSPGRASADTLPQFVTPRVLEKSMNRLACQRVENVTDPLRRRGIVTCETRSVNVARTPPLPVQCLQTWLAGANMNLGTGEDRQLATRSRCRSQRFCQTSSSNTAASVETSNWTPISFSA